MKGLIAIAATMCAVEIFAFGLLNVRDRRQTPAAIIEHVQPSAPGQVAWEYASYFVGPEDILWRSPTESMVAHGPEDLYRKISGRTIESRQLVVTDLFNLLGEKGWELISLGETPAGRTFYFKRMKPTGKTQ